MNGCLLHLFDLLHGTPDGPLLTNADAKANGDFIRLFECETTAVAGCLVNITGSLRTNPGGGVRGFWLWASGKVDIETVSHFLPDCPNFREHFDSLWANLTVKITKFNDVDGRQISEFIAKLDRHKKALFYSWGVFPLPFDAATATMIT